MKTVILLIFIQLVLSENCGDGWYFNEKQGECRVCISGYICVNGSLVECPDGYFSEGGSDSTCIKCGCDNCLKGDIKNETTGDYIKCAGSCPIEGTCYPGYGVESYTKACVLCHPGQFSEGGNSECWMCPPGWISTEYGSTKCIECKDKPVTSGGKECVDCPPGFYLDMNTRMCGGCPENTYTNETNSLSCIPCGPNEHSDIGWDRCLPGAPVERHRVIMEMPRNKYYYEGIRQWEEEERRFAEEELKKKKEEL